MVPLPTKSNQFLVRFIDGSDHTFSELSKHLINVSPFQIDSHGKPFHPYTIGLLFQLSAMVCSDLERLAKKCHRIDLDILNNRMETVGTYEFTGIDLISRKFDQFSYHTTSVMTIDCAFAFKHCTWVDRK